MVEDVTANSGLKAGALILARRRLEPTPNNPTTFGDLFDGLFGYLFITLFCVNCAA
jgi:hypothetical protein